MGYWTYTLANRALEWRKDGYDYLSKCKLGYGCRAVVVCPDDTHIIEPYYDGYGRFGGYDIFELVVEWNKDHLEEIFQQLEKNAAELYGEENKTKYFGSYLKEVAIAYQNNNMKKVKSLVGKFKDQMTRNEWLRDLGIAIAQDWIPYPIKIVNNVKGIKKYKDLPVSHYCQ